MAEVVMNATQPALAAVKLAWWAEALERLDGAGPPAEPRLQAAAAELLPRGLRGSELARLEAGWRALLDEHPDEVAVAERGAVLFGLAARLLEAGHPDLEEAGHRFALRDAARRKLLTEADGSSPAFRSPRALRPLTALAALAERPLNESEATPGRAWTLLRHRITGR